MSANPPGVTIVFFAWVFSTAPLGMSTLTYILLCCSWPFMGAPLIGLCVLSAAWSALLFALRSLLSSARDFRDDDDERGFTTLELPPRDKPHGLLFDKILCEDEEGEEPAPGQ